jgi:hypothetical protein
MPQQECGKQAKFGCFLIIPLKYDPATFRQDHLEKTACYTPLVTMDLNENIKAMLDRSNTEAIGACYAVERADFVGPFVGAEASADPQGFRVSNGQGTFLFNLASSYFYVFHTQVAFFCLSITFSQMEALQAICNPGFADNAATFDWADSAGNWHPFSMEKGLSNFLEPFGLCKFFDGPSSFLLDAYAHIFALVPGRFNTLEEMQKITFHLHKMVPMDSAMEDASEEDLCYVYGVKDQILNSYRWGCCVASQTLSYVVADAHMDFEKEQEAQARDGLPVVLLSLYEKYTCLRFTELIKNPSKGKIKSLKNLMLRFQAFGTVTPANLSRWHNVKQIYAYLLQVNDLSTAVQDISSKINILTAHQEEIEHAKSEAVINIITIFGIVSILASVLSIVQILSGGDTLIWISTILTTVMLILFTAIAIWNRQK